MTIDKTENQMLHEYTLHKNMQIIIHNIIFVWVTYI